jgi:hypothetical protein
MATRYSAHSHLTDKCTIYVNRLGCPSNSTQSAHVFLTLRNGIRHLNYRSTLAVALPFVMLT